MMFPTCIELLSPRDAYELGHRDGCAQGSAGSQDIIKGLEDEIDRLRTDLARQRTGWKALGVLPADQIQDVLDAVDQFDKDRQS